MQTTATNTKILYTGKTRTTGGREGMAISNDQQLQIQLGLPGSGKGANPEQLLAAGWSACFIGAMGIAAQSLGTKLPAATAVNAEVDLATSENGFGLQARLYVELPGMDRELAQQVITAAHNTCPYSKAVKHAIPVDIHLV
ncbi:Ohr subfamily peroxiredoxin [Chitinophaga dinghuensis]|uniref:Ohr subfamily peroxiredoxin n=1 Tax=Chitinophaga dinghuensis TaxID=1539050 RepID=A0A327VSE3_9BACT|nr:Ohr family peroxiredoxin [Chitinophaga dinghuensis]RAJ77486.1 Ohr subfamily peroxiredoxin [Chitinophaga dinghuensis]